MNDFSDPNHRPLRVLTFLAAHATESFNLAEIARHLGLPKGSAHRVMTALTNAGFVSRHPRHKTFTLGLALVAIGQAALDRYPGVGIARREMARLRAELGVGLGATAIVNREYLLLGRDGTPRTYDGLTLVGERRAVVPSIGIGQIAWRSEEEIEEYLATGAAYLDAEMMAHLRIAMPLIRRRGFSMAAEGTGLHNLIKATLLASERMDSGAIPSAIISTGEISNCEHQMLDWNEAPDVGVNYIAAPVFSPDGDVCLEIVMSGFPNGVRRAELERYTAKLVQAADLVTSEIRGRKPLPY